MVLPEEMTPYDLIMYTAYLQEKQVLLVDLVITILLVCSVIENGSSYLNVVKFCK